MADTKDRVNKAALLEKLNNLRDREVIYFVNIRFSSHPW